MKVQTDGHEMCKPFAAGCAGLLLMAGLSSVAHAVQSRDANAPASGSSSLPAAVHQQLTGQAAELRALRREVAEHMSDIEIAAAQREARAWMTAH
jgi:hypothetical protein